MVVVDQLWDDDLFEEPSEAYVQHKTFIGQTAVAKQTAAPRVSSAKLVNSEQQALQQALHK